MVSGTGTDTENGVHVSARVVNSSGAPVSHVEISVLELATRADSTLTSPLYDEQATLRTDLAGHVNFYLKKNGTFMAVGRRGDSTLFIDTLRTKVPPGNPLVSVGVGHPEFQVETPLQATGKIRFHSGLTVDSGHVLLRGTKIVSALTDSGTYHLGWLPPSVQKTTLTVTYQGRAREIRYVKISAQDARLTMHMSAAGAYCLTESTTDVRPDRTSAGSLSHTEDLARVVGRACAHRTGALVRVLEVNETGAVTNVHGSFVIPAPDAPNIWGPGADSSAVPAQCIEAETNLTAGLTGRATLHLSDREIVVNDFRNGKGCLQ